MYKLQAIQASLKKESQRALTVESAPALEAKNKIKKLEVTHSYTTQTRLHSITHMKPHILIVSPHLQSDKLDTQLEIVKNVADMPIPMVPLKYLELNDGVVGFLGIISSIIGCYAAWPAS